MATTDTTKTSLDQYRVAMLEELGFTKKEAKALSEARTFVSVKGAKGVVRTYEQKVDYHYVRRMINGGATTEQVLAILL